MLNKEKEIIILTEQDIINTYNKKQQEQCRLYYQYKKIKQQNPKFGYKRIATLLKQPYGKTRWWHTNKHLPTPIQTINWLKEKELIPLTTKNTKLFLIAKLLGTTFGDGGIFTNLNAIFLSSSEINSIKEFEKDISLIFSKEITLNSRIIEGGEYGHSWCYQNTNRKVIRLFKALSAPIGKKSQITLKIPNWILTNQNLADNFFSSFFGNEIGIPKIHKDNKRTDSLDLGLVCKKELLKNRINFLNSIKKYLESKGIEANSTYVFKHKQEKDKILIKLAINLNFDNLMNFYKNINISYSNNKQNKLIKTLNDLKKLKLQRFNKLTNTLNALTQQNYSKEWTRKNLRLTDKALNFILKQEHLEKWN
ncbi:MAG: hypothetical protein KJ674_02875 [Nanoarchaeota archaeon]|nr:hypothetical protein [Nanoarchaeota archaeon]